MYCCPVDLLFDWFGIICMTTDNFYFYLQNRLIQTGQTGGQLYSDTSPLVFPGLIFEDKARCPCHDVQYNGAQYNAIQHKYTQYGVIQYENTQNNIIQYNSAQYYDIQHNDTLYNAIQY